MTRANSSNPNDTLPDLQALSGLAPQLASTFVSVAADIALVLDAQGVIQHVALGNDPILGSTGQWLGKSWADTVTGSTRRKIELLLSEVQSSGVTRRREVNHPSAHAASVEPGLSDDIPVAYSAIRLGRDGPVLAVGRDLRTVAAIQQRFVEASQAMERDYWSQRQAEQQVRTLYQVATDAVLLVDAHTLQVVDANRAAYALLAPRLLSAEKAINLGASGPAFDSESESAFAGTLVGSDAAACVLNIERPGFTELLVTARASGRPAAMHAHAAPPSLGTAPSALVPVEVSATPLRSGADMLLMVNLRSIEPERDPLEATRRRAALVDGHTDALAITDSSGRVLTCNPAFERLCKLAPGANARRQTLAELLGDPALTLATTLQQARRQGLAHAGQVFVGHATGAQPTAGAAARTWALELWAQLLAEGDQECLGLRLRALPEQSADSLQAMTLAGPVLQLSQAINQLADQVGLVALPQLLQQATALAEVHLLQTALQRSQGSIGQAAHLLGITPQALQQRLQTLRMDTPQHAATGSASDSKNPA